MSNVQIYERDTTPELEPGQVWIRLKVHDEQSEEDREAEELFRSLADALDRFGRYKAAYVLTILRLQKEKEQFVGPLPQIVNGRSCEGIDEIREFVASYIDAIRKPAIV